MASLGNAPATPWAGSIAGFDILQWGWKQLHDPLVRYAYRLVRQRQVAEDAVMESFVRAHQKILGDEFRGLDQGSGNLEKVFRVWIYRITRNVCIDHLRQHQSISIDDAVECTSNSENSQILSLVIRESLRQLPPDLAVAVQLFDLEDLTAAEAAQLVGIRVSAFKSRLYRGRQRLRYLLHNEAVNWPLAENTPTEELKEMRISERNEFFTYAECPFTGVNDFVIAHFRAHQTARYTKIHLSRNLRLAFNQNTAGSDLRQACHQTIRNTLKQMSRIDLAAFWCGLFDRHVPGTEDPVSAKSTRSKVGSSNGQAILSKIRVVSNAVRPIPPGPVMHPDFSSLPEPRPQPLEVIRPITQKIASKKPRCKKQIKPKALPFIGPQGFILNIGALAQQLADQSKGRRSPTSFVDELRAARRLARNGEPLSDLARGEIIDLIYARYPDSEAKAMRSVRAMTVEFPPRQGTPEFLLPPPLTLKLGR